MLGKLLHDSDIVSIELLNELDEISTDKGKSMKGLLESLIYDEEKNRESASYVFDQIDKHLKSL
jgi:hypothetical protein